MAFRTKGLPAYESLPGAGRVRLSRWLPRRPDKFVLRCGQWDYLLDWRPFHGLQVTKVAPASAGEFNPEDDWPREGACPMRRLKVDDGLGTFPAAVVHTKTLVKFPRLMEHCTSTKYDDDGAFRTPGYFWVKTQGSTWIVTLFDPDAGARLDCRAATVDDALALAETYLGAADAPWEVDAYLRERMAKKKKKKAG